MRIKRTIAVVMTGAALAIGGAALAAASTTGGTVSAGQHDNGAPAGHILAGHIWAD